GKRFEGGRRKRQFGCSLPASDLQSLMSGSGSKCCARDRSRSSGLNVRGGLLRADRPHGRQWLLAVVGLLLLHISHPLTWGQEGPGLWFAPVGLGLALTAWLGWRALALIAVDGLLVQLLAFGTVPQQSLPGAILQATLLAAEVGCAWWLYHVMAGGARQLDSPQSATLFLLLVPGLVAACFAAGRAALRRHASTPVDGLQLAG